jgi:acetyl esterase/lipase
MRQMTAADVVYEQGIVYGSGSGRELALDVLRPRDAGDRPRPAVIWVHGGGWVDGERAPSPNPPLAAHGFVTASISYRFSQEAIFPAQIHDVKAAIRFLRANASRWNADPDRIGIWGASAGGHLAALAAVTANIAGLEGEGGNPGISTAVQAAVPLCPPTDFLVDWTMITDYPPHPEVVAVLPQLLGGGDVADPVVRARAELASPLVHAWHGAAPMLVVHGSRDDLVPIAQARSFVSRLGAVGADVELLELAEDDHALVTVFGEEGAPSTATMTRIIEFFEMTLGPVPAAGG